MIAIERAGTYQMPEWTLRGGAGGGMPPVARLADACEAGV